MAGNISYKDTGWGRIKRQFMALRNQGVKVGIRAAGAGGDLNGGVRIIDYAVWNEFGTSDGRVPARPFMRRTADISRFMLPPFCRKLVVQVIDGQINANQAVNQLGLFYQAQIRMTILASPSWAKPNAPYTIEKKGSSIPLIDYGAMIGAIDYERVRI